MTKYKSTQNQNYIVDDYSAMIQGISQDGGLFIPCQIPQLDYHTLLTLSYQQIATKLLHLYFDSFSVDEIANAVEKAYQKFSHPEVVPVTKYQDTYVMELFHGPTYAFKDVALTLLPHLLRLAYQYAHSDKKIAIITATSGDTGKAALEGFKDVENTNIAVFYPEVGVSYTQKLQMQTSQGNNVKVYGVKGNFDDCQKAVKQAMTSANVKEYCQTIDLTSANSINIGRLVPQVVYYYTTYIKLINDGQIKDGQTVSFVVPTGNFGDIFAGYLAKCMGLPIAHLICASNTNHILTDFLKTGIYDTKREFVPTISPSMDILISSNLERLLYCVCQDDQTVKKYMYDLKTTGKFTVDQNVLSRIQETFYADWTDIDTTKEVISQCFQNGYLIDPHSAVAMHAYQTYQDKHPEQVCVVLSTASPFKFAKDVYESITHHEINDLQATQKLQQLSKQPVPTNIANLTTLPVRFQQVVKKEDLIETVTNWLKELI